jgi:hypothetical protein
LDGRRKRLCRERKLIRGRNIKAKGRPLSFLTRNSLILVNEPVNNAAPHRFPHARALRNGRGGQMRAWIILCVYFCLGVVIREEWSATHRERERERIQTNLLIHVLTARHALTTKIADRCAEDGWVLSRGLLARERIISGQTKIENILRLRLVVGQISSSPTHAKVKQRPNSFMRNMVIFMVESFKSKTKSRCSPYKLQK